MEKTVHMTMLFDFFGELLTDKQKEYFDLYYNENLTLSEIAENEGISRQGVRDIIVRAEAILNETEDKTGIVKRYAQLQGDIVAIEGYIREIAAFNQARFKNGKLLELSNSVYDRLQLMKG
jgi:Uncharacterized protein conserved in bacteria